MNKGCLSLPKIQDQIKNPDHEKRNEVFKKGLLFIHFHRNDPQYRRFHGERIGNLRTRTKLTTTSPGDILFRIYDNVTDNCILDFQRKISICNALAPLLFWFLSFMSWDHTLLVEEQKKDGLRLFNAEKDLPKVNSTVVFLMHSEWSGLWILANFRYVIIFSGFEKITPRYQRLRFEDHGVYMMNLCWKEFDTLPECKSVCWINYFVYKKSGRNQ